MCNKRLKVINSDMWGEFQTYDILLHIKVVLKLIGYGFCTKLIFFLKSKENSFSFKKYIYCIRFFFMSLNLKVF